MLEKRFNSRYDGAAVTAQAISGWLNGKSLPKLDTVRVLAAEGEFAGLLGLDLSDGSFVLFHCKNVVWATGGPAGIYADSVYPAGHRGEGAHGYPDQRGGDPRVAQSPRHCHLRDALATSVGDLLQCAYRGHVFLSEPCPVQ